jgi:hypothetical protein
MARPISGSAAPRGVPRRGSSGGGGRLPTRWDTRPPARRGGGSRVPATGVTVVLLALVGVGLLVGAAVFATGAPGGSPSPSGAAPSAAAPRESPPPSGAQESGEPTSPGASIEPDAAATPVTTQAGRDEGPSPSAIPTVDGG